MNQDHLFDNERIITQSDRDLITLTNLRIRYSDDVWGKSHVISLLLEKVSSVEIHYRSKPILLVLGILSVIVGVFLESNGAEGSIAVFGVIGFVFILLHIFSRKHFMTISSEGGSKINFHIKRMKHSKVLTFVNQLEGAIINRREELK